MRNDRYIKLNWTSGLSITGKSARIPNRSGIYAYGVVRQFAGLPCEIEWVYIGKGVNLRQRITQHDCRSESNPDLQRWLRNPPANAELWFAEVPEGSLIETESRLIATINPHFNTNHRTDLKGDSTKSTHPRHERKDAA